MAEVWENDRQYYHNERVIGSDSNIYVCRADLPYSADWIDDEDNTPYKPITGIPTARSWTNKILYYSGRAVEGTDNNVYRCTAALPGDAWDDNTIYRPITGDNWYLYWEIVESWEYFWRLLLAPPDYGDGTAEDPYQIWTAEDLNAIRDYPDKHYIQMADIDLEYWDWVPICSGHRSNTFTGTYNGNNYKINNLCTRVGPHAISPVSTEYHQVGLFGHINIQSPGFVKLENITIENAYIDMRGAKYTGILVGYCQVYVLIKNCKVQGSMVCTGEKNAWSGGGLIGECWLGDIGATNIIDCSANITITSFNSIIGGLVGVISGSSPSVIEKCFNTGSIKDVHENNPTIGGLIGYFNPDSAVLKNCYSRCNVESISKYTGGLVGQSQSNIANCYSTGYINAHIEAGGLIGHTEGVVSFCYYDSETSGRSDNDGRGQPRTTAEMTYPYSDPNNVYILWAFHGEPDVGDYHYQSTNYDIHSSESNAYVTFDSLSDNEVYFIYRVSSEENWDIFYIYLNDDLKIEVSGEIDWTGLILDIVSGENTLRFRYVKDGSVSEGEDRAFVDYIVVGDRIEKFDDDNFIFTITGDWERVAYDESGELDPVWYHDKDHSKNDGYPVFEGIITLVSKCVPFLFKVPYLE